MITQNDGALIMGNKIKNIAIHVHDNMMVLSGSLRQYSFIRCVDNGNKKQF